ncbi:MAG: hypothetical protein KDH88_17265 [Chromatiales bacterium]|nr:hypothetical protein [Chromatiales bacterium]
MASSRLVAVLVVLLWYVVLGLFFVVVRPELAYSYGHWLHGLENNLPGLTAKLSLPVLGPEISTSEQRYSPVFWLIWGFVALPPLALLRVIKGVRDRLLLLEAFLFWGAAYLLVVLCIAVLVGLGLWLPFSAA